jgi:dephospho-CoA kinase
MFFAATSGSLAGFYSWSVRHIYVYGIKSRKPTLISAAISLLSTSAAIAAASLSSSPLTSCAISLVFAFLARRLRCIGLTGGVASGKSTIAAALNEVSGSSAGGSVLLIHIDLDSIAREIVQPGASALNRLSAHFGGDILDANGALNRAVLREKITRDPKARSFVNSVTHPEIFKVLLSRVAWHKWFLGRSVIIDAPLLFESGYFLRFLCCPIIVVACNEEQQVKRLVARADGAATGEADARRLIATQWSLERKTEQADIIFENSIDCSPGELKSRALALFLDMV